jgi:hypothetical protein
MRASGKRSLDSNHECRLQKRSLLSLLLVADAVAMQGGFNEEEVRRGSIIGEPGPYLFGLDFERVYVAIKLPWGPAWASRCAVVAS